MVTTLLLPLRMYLEKMCEEINDTLQEAGQLTVSDLTKEFGLPTAFLLEVKAVVVLKQDNETTL